MKSLRIAGHEATRTTQLYNRTGEELSLDEIERVHINRACAYCAYIDYQPARFLRTVAMLMNILNGRAGSDIKPIPA